MLLFLKIFLSESGIETPVFSFANIVQIGNVRTFSLEVFNSNRFVLVNDI
jgi:hypothetical protein